MYSFVPLQGGLRCLVGFSNVQDCWSNKAQLTPKPWHRRAVFLMHIAWPEFLDLPGCAESWVALKMRWFGFGGFLTAWVEAVWVTVHRVLDCGDASGTGRFCAAL